MPNESQQEVLESLQDKKCAYQGWITISGILAGFAFSGLVEFVKHDGFVSGLLTATFLITTLAFFACTFGMLCELMVIDRLEKKIKAGNVHVARHDSWGRNILAFFIGILGFVLSIGIVGFLHSTGMGILSAVAAATTVVVLGINIVTS